MNIVFCLPGKTFSGNFLKCWTSLISFCQAHGINVFLSQTYNPNVYYVRAQCLGADVLRGRNQLPFNGQIPYDYLMWIDSDVLFTTSDFEVLLKNNFNIVSGLYPLDGGNQYCVVQNWEEDHFLEKGTFRFLNKDDPLITSGIPFKAAYAGMGFMLIKKGVFEKLSYPWFSPEFFRFKNDIHDFCSEDVGFCIKAAKEGFDVMVDPRVVVKHEKTTIY